MDIIDDDIFEEMRKWMRNPFGDIFNKTIFGDEEEIHEELDKTLKKDPSKDKKSRSYSISYKFGTGMKEPEIHIQGDIDQTTVNKILKGFPHISKEIGMNLQSNPSLDIGKTKSNSIEPYTEIEENPDGLSIYMEMPGIGQKNIKTKWEKNSLIITAEREDVLFEKRIQISFEAKKDVIIHSNNGIITIEIHKK